MSSCFWCDLTRKKVKSSRFSFKFSNGTTVYADKLNEATDLMKSIEMSRQFWASETTQGTWDVQLSEKVIVYDVHAETVTDAVKIARWKVHLDSCFKKIDGYY